MATSVPNGQTANENPFINSLLWKSKWDQNTGPIAYTFATPKNLDGSLKLEWAWMPEEKQAATAALNSWSAVANISLQEVFDTNSANLDLFLNRQEGTGTLARQLGPNGNLSSANTEGLGIYYTGHHTDWEQNLDVGGHAYFTFLHEFGHALGLSHPFSDNSNTASLPGVDGPRSLGTDGQNTALYTAMSYNYQGQWWSPAEAQNYGFIGGPMAFDIAAIQHIYGKNMSTGAGNNVYDLPDANTTGNYYSCIWDAGGVDELRYRGTLDATIDLRAAPLTGKNAGGYLSRADDIFGGYTIANDVVIEHASGGDGNDTITGNSRKNILDGFYGDDKLYGGAGRDLLDGGYGFDLMNGGRGTDTVAYAFYLPSTGMVVDLDAGKTTFSGTTLFDTLVNIEKVIGGGGADRIVGNSVANTLDGYLGDDTLLGGAKRDVLIGGMGADTLKGGSEADTFRYTTYSHSSGGFVDRVTDFVSDEDNFDVSAANIAAGLGTRRFQSTFSDEIFADIGTAKANEMLVLTVTGAKAGTYLFINDGIAQADWTKDVIINITGLTGRLAIDDFV